MSIGIGKILSNPICGIFYGPGGLFTLLHFPEQLLNNWLSDPRALTGRACETGFSNKVNGKRLFCQRRLNLILPALSYIQELCWINHYIRYSKFCIKFVKRIQMKDIYSIFKQRDRGVIFWKYQNLKDCQNILP